MEYTNKQLREHIFLLERQINKRNKVINYCISKISNSSQLKYIVTLTREMDK